MDNNNLLYFSQLASNRSFNGQQLKTHRFQPYSQDGYLKGVGHRVSVTKHCNRYYVTNATGKCVTRQLIVKEYRDRWKIEVLFRNLKQLCHLEECQNRKTIAQKHYVYACNWISYAVGISYLLLMLCEHFENSPLFDNSVIHFIGRNTLWIYLWHIPFVLLSAKITDFWILRFLLIVNGAVAVDFIQHLAVTGIDKKCGLKASRVTRFFVG